MKPAKSKKLYNIISLLIVAFAVCFALSGCGKSAPTTDEAVFDTEKLKQKAIETAALYKDLYLQSEKKKSEYFPYNTELTQSGIDEIESFLISKGYPVINSDGKYPDYLENSEGLREFWGKFSKNQNAMQDVISILESGGLYYISFQYCDGVKYRAGIEAGWDENGEPVILSEDCGEIIDWELIGGTDFYYQAYMSGVAYDDYSLIRLEPHSRELDDLNAKYVLPIGYSSNNMFVCEWTNQNFGELCFNDLLEAFYKLKNNRYFPQDDYPVISEPYMHSYISAELFESTIKPYFDISSEEFRTRCLYDSDKDAYPWQMVGCGNVTTYPSVEPEVVDYRNNNDGTITLTVNARCNEYKTPRLFTHEVTVRIISDTEYRYLSNKITYRSEYELPPSRPRLPSQRSGG